MAHVGFWQSGSPWVAPRGKVVLIENPFAMAVDDRTHRVFIVGAGPNDAGSGLIGRIGAVGRGGVSTLDAASRRVLRTVRTGTIGYGSSPAVVVDGRTGRVFVLNSGTTTNLEIGVPIGLGTVSVLDARTGAILRTVTVGSTPVAAAVDVRTNRVFVLNQDDDVTDTPQGPGSVSVLDAMTGHVLRTVGVGKGPVAVAVDERSGRVFILAAGGVSVLDAISGTVLRTMSYSVACAIAVDAWAGLLIVQDEFMGPNPNGSYGRAFVVDERSGRTLHAIGLDGNCTQGGMAMDQTDGHAVLFETPTAETNNPGVIAVLDPRDGQMVQDTQVTDHFGFGAWAVDERRHHAFAAYENHISVVDTRSGAVLRTVTLPPPAALLTGIAVAQSTVWVFVTEPGGNVVDMLNERTLAVLPLAGAGPTP